MIQKNSSFIRTLIFTSILLSITFFSCNKKDLSKIASGTWNPNFAIPLAYGEFGVYDILAVTDSLDELAIDSESGLISLFYTGELYDLLPNNFISLDPVSESFNFSLLDFGETPSPSFNQTANASFNETIEFELEGQELHEILFHSGTLSINVTSDFQHDIIINLTFPEMTQNGVVVSETSTLTYSGGTTTENITIDLQNTLSDFNATGTPNLLPIDISVTLEGTGNPIVGTETINLDFQFTNLDYEHFRGLINPETINFTDSIAIRLFTNITDGTFSFTNPRITFDITNSFGIPIQLDFNELKTINESSGQEYPLAGFNDQLTIPLPTTMGQEASKTFELNKDNTTNMDQIVSSTPNYFFYDLDLNVNPSGAMAPLHFITRNSSLKLNAEVELPLEGFAYGFEFRDTLDFEVGEDFEDAEAINFVMLRLIIENGFPVDIDAQINFMDEHHNIVFSAFTDIEDIVQSGAINEQGRVINATRKISDITLEKDDIELLSHVKYFEIHALGQTKDGPSETTVRIHDDYTIKTQLSMQIEASQSL